MSQPGPSAEAMDRVATEAMKQVQSGMRLGLGTGRAAAAFIRRLGAAVKEGLDVVGVPTSERSDALARELGIPLATLAEVNELDLAFDGADEVTPDLDLTKGLGGALLRERVVAHCAKRFVILVTPEKRVDKLASRTHIPIEVVPFAGPVVERGLLALGGKPSVRQGDDGPYHTDNGNLILDTTLEPLDDARAVDAAIRAIPGVVDTGLFLDMADEVLIGTPDGVERLTR
ncbi:MAG TPA: ribose-5-phosphate isomerase RpiA [Polyangiaceae bacterium]|nr:ribose-5-phosphate isomerase RpiA [Polyangiaceae bacterium]